MERAIRQLRHNRVLVSTGHYSVARLKRWIMQFVAPKNLLHHRSPESDNGGSVRCIRVDANRVSFFWRFTHNRSIVAMQLQGSHKSCPGREGEWQALFSCPLQCRHMALDEGIECQSMGVRRMSWPTTVCLDRVWLGIVLKGVIHLRGGVWTMFPDPESKGVSRKRTLLRPVRKCKESPSTHR